MKSSRVLAIGLGLMLFMVGNFMFFMSAETISINYFELKFHAENVNSGLFFGSLLIIVFSIFFMIFGNRLLEDEPKTVEVET